MKTNGKLLDTFCALFAHFMTNKNFAVKSAPVIFLFLDFYRCAKFQERLMNRFREKPSTELRKYLLTYRQVDKHEFMVGIQKVCIVIKPTIPDLR